MIGNATTPAGHAKRTTSPSYPATGAVTMHSEGTLLSSPLSAVATRPARMTPRARSSSTPSSAGGPVDTGLTPHVIGRPKTPLPARRAEDAIPHPEVAEPTQYRRDTRTFRYLRDGEPDRRDRGFPAERRSAVWDGANSSTISGPTMCPLRSAGYLCANRSRPLSRYRMPGNRFRAGMWTSRGLAPRARAGCRGPDVLVCKERSSSLPSCPVPPAARSGLGPGHP